MATDVPLAVSVPLPGLDARASFDLAREAATWGYRACWGAEVDGPDAVSLLAALAVTTDLDLGVAILPVQTRTAFVLGMTAVSLAQLTGGRFVLGLGASSEVLVSRFGGVPYERPLTHLREMVAALRPVLVGERSTFDGTLVRLGGYKPPVPPPRPIPLYLGSLNPASLRLAGEVADGLCLNQVAPEHIPTMLAEVRAGAEAVGRTLPDPFPVVMRLFCAVTDDVSAVSAMVPHVFAPYAAVQGYNRFYRWMGYEEEAAAIAEASERRDRAAMAAAYSPRIVADLFPIGDAPTVADRIRTFVAAGVTVPVIAPLAVTQADAGATLSAIAAVW